jgi:hypothetical protein
MALKLRRQAGMITNENLRNRSSRRQPAPLGTGADSFKRVLGRCGRTRIISFEELLHAFH